VALAASFLPPPQSSQKPSSWEWKYEIQVTEHVAQKISALRTQSADSGDAKDYQNISVLRGNTQKFFPNFFEKYQVKASPPPCLFPLECIAWLILGSWRKCSFVSLIHILNGQSTKAQVTDHHSVFTKSICLRPSTRREIVSYYKCGGFTPMDVSALQRASASGGGGD
jgi:hypothetical protein